MAFFPRRMLHHGRDRIQLSQWRSDAAVATMVPFPQGDKVAVDAVRAAVDSAAAEGYTSTYTAALTPGQAEPFVEAGFAVAEELHLLRCRLVDEPHVERSRTRRGRRADWPEVLEVDRLAFDEFWQFDRVSLSDAMRATPRSRFQVTRTTPVWGYHVTGMAGANAYLQRVAVHPEAQGQGWGTTLVNHSLRWAYRGGAITMHVNTQLHNERAVALYERCGFSIAPYRLRVMEYEFELPAEVDSGE